MASLSWCYNQKIYLIAHKISRTLNFAKWNLELHAQMFKETAYLTLVRSCLEYAFGTPPNSNYVLTIIISEHKAPARRWILSDYNYCCNVNNNMLVLLLITCIFHTAVIHVQTYDTCMQVWYDYLYHMYATIIILLYTLNKIATTDAI